jgi:hypothetical protein
MRSSGFSYKQQLSLFLFFASGLLVMPTNIYINGSYLFFIMIFLIKPALAKQVFNTSIKRKTLVRIGLPIFFATSLCTLYYYILLRSNPPIDFLNSYTPFNLSNLTQALAIFYHFTSLRFHIYVVLIISFVAIFINIKRRVAFDMSFVWPGLLFFMPFIFFFIHGAIIVQRTFLSLLPFFVCLIALLFRNIPGRFRLLPLDIVFIVLNIACFIMSFGDLIRVSNENNEKSVHKQDLVEHYYLINFNAKETIANLRLLLQKQKYPVYLCDDFGQTGLGFYLQEYKIPFTRCGDALNVEASCYIVANNKTRIDKQLSLSHCTYSKISEPDKQYNIYLVLCQ